MVLAAFLEHVDSVISLLVLLCGVLVAWFDLRSRVKEHDRRLEDLEESRGAHAVEVAAVKENANRILIEMRTGMSEIKADVKIIKAAVQTMADSRSHRGGRNDA